MTSSYELKLRLFNVGQGDHLLLELPDGSYGIFDFFYSESHGWTEPPTLTYLKKIRSDDSEKEMKIAFVCLSHPDYDHINGLKDFFEWVEQENIKVERIWRYAGPDTSEMQKHLEKAKKNKKRIPGSCYKYKYLSPELDALSNYVSKHDNVVYLQDIKTLSNKLANFIDIWCLAPLGSHLHPLSADIWVRFFEAYLATEPVDMGNKNLFSSVIQVIFGENRLLFGGDTELKIWNACIKHADNENLNVNWESTFIKASHHGSDTSSSIEFWERILSNSLTYIGISAGDDKHPSKTTIEHLEQVKNSTGKNFKLLGTSACAECFNKYSYDTLESDWISEDLKNTYEAINMKKDRSSKYTENPNGKRLLSYVLTFSLEDSAIKVEKEIVSANFTKKCFYLHQGKGFPHCVG